jgi:hypothetical protein
LPETRSRFACKRKIAIRGDRQKFFELSRASFANFCDSPRVEMRKKEQAMKKKYKKNIAMNKNV